MIRRFEVLILLFFFVGLAFPGTQALAQAEGESSGSEISLFLGSMLPNQIDGVTEIMPLVGGRFGLNTLAGVLELGAFNSHAYGVDFTNFDLSVRGDLPVAEGIAAGIYGGLDINWYAPYGSTARLTETGIHLGAAGLMSISSNLWLRGDLKFMGGPGTSLLLLFGIMFR